MPTPSMRATTAMARRNARVTSYLLKKSKTRRSADFQLGYAALLGALQVFCHKRCSPVQPSGYLDRGADERLRYHSASAELCNGRALCDARALHGSRAYRAPPLTTGDGAKLRHAELQERRKDCKNAAARCRIC